MITITPPYPGPALVTDDPAVAGAAIVEHSRFVCRETIISAAPAHRQLNAALGLLDTGDVAEITSHIAACRAAQNAVQFAVQAILADTELDAAGKLAALDALS